MIVLTCVLGGAVGGMVALRRVEVVGESMAPTLQPGDRLAVVVLPGRWPLRLGDLVALRDPRRPETEGRLAPGRLLVKRVTALGPSGLEVRGDAPEASTDSRQFGPVPRGAVVGRVLYRYAPPPRAGRLH
jgi:nickel-type superoxide dismutase maturation protease